MSIKNPLITLLFFAFFTVSFASSAVAEPVEISIGVSDGLAPRIIQIMEHYPDVCAQEDFFSPQWLRTSLEFVIVCRAVRLGGLEATYTFKNYPNSARTRAELKKGSTMLMVDLPWGHFSKHESFYQSIAVLQVGDFVKGLYTRPDHTKLLQAKTLEELKKFTAVTSRTWFYDWDILERMKVKKHAVPKYIQMGEMVKAGRADYLIAEFPGADDLSQYINGERFIPVPGVKVALLGSRHVAVSKKFAQSKRVFDAIQIGLKIMHERGLIKQGYRTVGFINPKIENWKIICCEENQETDPNR
jgi:ABC-type amino acid transport substrate-binding protein